MPFLGDIAIWAWRGDDLGAKLRRPGWCVKIIFPSCQPIGNVREIKTSSSMKKTNSFTPAVKSASVNTSNMTQQEMLRLIIATL